MAVTLEVWGGGPQVTSQRRRRLTTKRRGGRKRRARRRARDRKGIGRPTIFNRRRTRDLVHHIVVHAIIGITVHVCVVGLLAAILGDGQGILLVLPYGHVALVALRALGGVVRLLLLLVVLAVQRAGYAGGEVLGVLVDVANVAAVGPRNTGAVKVLLGRPCGHLSKCLGLMGC